MIDLASPPLSRVATVEPAVPGDAPAISRLVARCRPETIPVSERHVRRHVSRFLTLRIPGAGIVAAAAMMPAGECRVELRSLAVAPEWRGHGLGRRLTLAVLERARRRGLLVVCVTLKPGFFSRLGFRRVRLDAAPEKPSRADTVDGRPRVALVWDPLRAPRSLPEVVAA